VKFRDGSSDALTCAGAGLGLIGVGAGNEARPRRSDRVPREGDGALRVGGPNGMLSPEEAPRSVSIFRRTARIRQCECQCCCRWIH
jgi:hypothetical protein